MGKREQFYFRRQEFIEPVEGERAIVEDRHEAKPGPRPFGEELPWDEVTVVLHLGEQNDVAGPKKLSSPGVRDEVDALGCSAGKHDLVGTGGAEVLGDADAGAFVGFGGARA